MKHIKTFEDNNDVEIVFLPKIFNELKKYEKIDSAILYDTLCNIIHNKIIGKVIIYTSTNYTIRKGKVKSIWMENSGTSESGLNRVDFIINFVDDKNVKNDELYMIKSLPINILSLENDAEKYNI